MMRLRRLGLDFFGHFTGQAIDFGPRVEGMPDFHILYGPNEAGKTTTMEGYLRLLYGFRPKNEEYGFLHDRKTLQVSGVLDIDGHEASYTRHANKLIDGSGTPVPQTAIDRALAGLGQDEYRKLLCLDDETIEQGGKEIIDSKGDIGRLLFAASAGIGDLSAVLDRGVEEARGLYLKGSGKTEFAALAKEIDAIKASIRDTDVTASAWRGLRDALATAKAEEEDATAERQILHARAARLAAMAEAVPLMARAAELRARLAAYRHYPERLDIDPEALVALLAERGRHEADCARLNDAIEASEQTLAHIERTPARLSLVEELALLDESRAEYRAAEKHLPARRAALDSEAQQMRRHADDLGVAAAVDPASLALSPAQIAMLDEGRTRLREARDKAALLREQATESTAQTAEAQTALDALIVEAPEEGGIAALLDGFDRTGHAVALKTLADAETRARAALAALCIKGREFAAPPAVSLTAGEAAEQIEALTRLTRDREEEIKQRDALLTEEARLDARIGAVTERAGIVADAAVQEAVETRDALWVGHRETLSPDSADRFETALYAVDGMAARRLEKAADLGSLRTLEDDRAACALNRAARETALARLEDALAAARAPLDAVMAEMGLTLSPTAGGLLAWLHDLETAQAEARAALEAARETAPIREQAEALAAALRPLLPDARPGDDLDALLTAAQARADVARHHATAVATARTERDTLRGAETRRARDLEKAETALAEAETDWTVRVAGITGGTVAPDILFASLDPVRGLRAAHQEWLKLTDRITKMQAEQSRFQTGTDALAAAHGIAPGDTPLDTFAALDAMGTEAQDADALWRETRAALDAETVAQEESARALARIAEDIARLGAVFDPAIPTGTIEELRESVGIAHETIAARREQEACEQDIRARLDVPDMAGAVAVLDGRSADDIAAAGTLLETDRDIAEERYRAAIEARRDAERTLDSVTDDADIARLVERRKTLELEMQEVAQTYLELRLGNALAEEAMRRYRDTHRSGMMTATETAFAALTNGAYTRLATQPDGQSETLLAIDAGGASKAAAAMSKGTRFQLFLALRAAAYEQMAANGAVLPFFCDDVFETFDEDRTRAACALMSRIGATGQAIYLTHHRHVVDIARDICGDAVTVHDLARADPPRPRPPGG